MQCIQPSPPRGRRPGSHSPRPASAGIGLKALLSASADGPGEGRFGHAHYQRHADGSDYLRSQLKRIFCCSRGDENRRCGACSFVERVSPVLGLTVSDGDGASSVKGFLWEFLIVTGEEFPFEFSKQNHYNGRHEAGCNQHRAI
jgi:hypothetical protein